jgi:ribosomal protein S27E
MRQDLKLTCASCGHVNHLTIVGAQPSFDISCAECGAEIKVSRGPKS